MQFSKKNAIFIYAILRQFKTERELNDYDEARIASLLEEIEVSLSDDEEVVEKNEEVLTKIERPDPDATVSAAALEYLPEISVVSPAGDKIQLEFSVNSNPDSVDVLFDGGSTVLDDVSHIKISGREVELFDGETWHFFTISGKKLPKSWSKLLVDGNTYSVESTDHYETSSEEEEEEEVD